MERSPEYHKTLEQVRRMPQETEAESAEKREQAKLLRMRVMFDNARCAKLLTEYEQGHPLASEEEIEAMFERDGVLKAHPEVINSFIASLEWSKQAVLEALEELKRGDGTYETDALFQWIVKNPKNTRGPIGNLELDTSYPHALMLYVSNQRDFQRIDTHKNSGGFYQPSVHVQKEKAQKDQSRPYALVFPLIVIRDSGNSFDLISGQKHEIGHSENTMLEGAADATEPVKFFWAEKPPLREGDVPTLKMNWLHDPAHARETPEWQNVLADMYAKAKDEILADYNAHPGNFDYVQDLLKQGGMYDYASRELNIPPASDLYTALWDEYRKTLESATNSAKNVAQEYAYYDDLEERLEAFRWVLAQIPLERWERQLKDTLFQEEADALKLFRQKEYSESKKGDAFFLSLREHQYEPLLPRINEFLRRDIEHSRGNIEEKISLNDRTSASVFPTRNGDIVTYDDGAKRYTVHLDGRIAVADRKKDFLEQEFLDPTSKEGKRVVKRIQMLAARDHGIHDAREAEAKRLAKGSPLLADVLAHAIEYGEGRAQEPFVLDGVELYPVGGNASARMYLGAKDGRLYYYCYDDALFTILPDGRGDQISEDQMIDRVTEQIFDEWYRMSLWASGKSEAEWRKEMPEPTLEAVGKHREKVFQEFMRMVVWFVKTVFGGVLDGDERYGFGTFFIPIHFLRRSVVQ